ncbi:hypothetical protein Tsp_07298, partial [Trichinella spiralis]|uniref:hypothetical protein n=1 Tax=Trichinella spiralis TaxID=6334 RepID=UPI0001EFC541
FWDSSSCFISALKYNRKITVVLASGKVLQFTILLLATVVYTTTIQCSVTRKEYS